MPVDYYDIDKRVFDKLAKKGEHLDNWQGAASEIADYVASWGMVRFWATSHSQQQKEGREGSAEDDLGKRRYFAWSVAREVLCEIADRDLDLKPNDTALGFNTKFSKLEFNQQILVTDLLINISDSIQFWTMRLKESQDLN